MYLLVTFYGDILTFVEANTNISPFPIKELVEDVSKVSGQKVRFVDRADCDWQGVKLVRLYTHETN